MIEINLPVAALSVNDAWKGQRFKTDEYKVYERVVAHHLPHAKKPIEGEVILMYEYGLEKKSYSRMDVGNLEKCITDIVVKLGYITDDRKVKALLQKKVLSENYYIKLTIYPLKKGLQGIIFML